MVYNSIFFFFFPILSSRTERSEVKDLGCIHGSVTETLRFALSDRERDSFRLDCISMSRSDCVTSSSEGHAKSRA